MNKISKYYTYLFCVLFVGVIAPDPGVEFVFSFRVFLYRIFQAALATTVIFITLKLLSRLIAEHIKSDRSLGD